MKEWIQHFYRSLELWERLVNVNGMTKSTKIKFAYDLRKHSVRGKKQYKLLFGRKSNLPVDFFLRDIKSLCKVQESFKNIWNKRLIAVNEKKDSDGLDV